MSLSELASRIPGAPKAVEVPWSQASILAPLAIVLAGCATAAVPLATPDPGMGPAREGPVVHLVREGERGAGESGNEPLGLFRVDANVIGPLYENRVVVQNGDKRHDRTSPITSEHATIERFVCTEPCDRRAIDIIGQEVFVGGAGVTSSDRIRLPVEAKRVEIRATPGNLDRYNVGLGLTTAGTVAGIGTLSTLPFGIGLQHPPLTLAGSVLAGVTAALLGAGIPLLVTGKTRVDIRTVAGATANGVAF